MNPALRIRPYLRPVALNSGGEYCNDKELKVDEPIDPLACEDVDTSEFALPVTYYELMQIRGDVLLMSDHESGDGSRAGHTAQKNRSGGSFDPRIAMIRVTAAYGPRPYHT